MYMALRGLFLLRVLFSLVEVVTMANKWRQFVAVCCSFNFFIFTKNGVTVRGMHGMSWTDLFRLDHFNFVGTAQLAHRAPVSVY